MKKQLIIAIVTGAAVLAWFAIRKKNQNNSNIQPEPKTKPIGKTHHLTNVFAKAKQHAMHKSNAIPVQ